MSSNYMAICHCLAVLSLNQGSKKPGLRSRAFSGNSGAVYFFAAVFCSEAVSLALAWVAQEVSG